MPLLRDLSEALKAKGNVPDHVTVLGENAEHWLSYLSQPQPWNSEATNLRNKASFLELTADIGSVISGQENTRDVHPPDWLMALVQWWHEKESTVITLNYDTLIERMARMIKFGAGDTTLPPERLYPIALPDVRRSPIFASERVSTFTLCKLHGSINWYYSGAESYYGETIYCAPVAAWDGTFKSQEDEGLAATGDKVPLIAPPTTEKVAYFQHEALRRIWVTAAEALSSATNLICIGYSLPITDLSIQLFLRSCRQNGSIPLTIVNQSGDARADYRRILNQSYEYPTGYTGPDAIKSFVDDLV